VYTAIGICHTGCADCLLAWSGPSIFSQSESREYIGIIIMFFFDRA
jgi:hypothetical protein